MTYQHGRGRTLLAAATLFFTSLSAGANFAEAQTRGGKVIVGVEQDIAGFDPLIVGVYDTGAIATAALLFDTLTRIDGDGKIQGRLAESWSSSADFKTWTFKLRPGIKFHDGSPFNAEAVAYNYRRMMDPKNLCRCAFYLTAIASVEAKDELTFVYNLNFPQTELPGLISPPTVTNVFHSPKAMEAQGQGYNRNPVGTGPFKLKSWQSGDRIVLERNPDYWNAGRPYLDEATIRPLPDPVARFASLQAGDVDIIWADRADDILKARKISTLTVNEYGGSGLSAIVLNTKTPALSDIRVRQALRHALNLEGFAQAVDLGIRKPAKDPYGQGSFVQCGDTGTLPYDPEKAKALLKDYGKPVTLKYMVTAEARGMGAGQVFQGFWKAVGIDVTLDPVDQTTFVTKSFQRQFEIGGWRMIDLADPDPQMYADFRTGSAVNIANYSNADVDKLLDEARVTEDRAKRSEAYCKIAEILNKEAPWIWIMENRYFNIAKNDLKGVHKQYSDTLDVADAYWDKK